MKRNLRKKHQIICTVVLLLLLPVVSSGQARSTTDNKCINKSLDGTTLYVGGTGPNNYSSIQSAIDNATDGDTVFVYNGIYYEHIFVDKTIQLIGQNRNNTIIDGGVAGYEGTVNIMTNNSQVRGFRIQNGTYDSGIVFGLNSTHNLIADNRIIHNADGIIFRGASENQITGNIIEYNGGNGIIMFGGDYDNFTKSVTDNRNIISGNFIGFSRTGNGVDLDGIQNVVSNNTIYENNGCGISVDFEIGSTITGNVIESNHYGGIYVSGDGITTSWTASFCLIAHNTIRRNDGDGINAGTAMFIKIQSNDIESNKGTGLNIAALQMSQIIQNNIVNNTNDVTFHNPRWLRWSGNYWGEPHIGPKIIRGYLVEGTGNIGKIPWFYFDWRPAKTPYLIS